MSIAKLFSRRFLASAATVPMIAGGLVLVTPGVAEAVTCGQSWTNKDPSSGQGITIPSQGQYTIPVHNGIYGDCTVTSYMSTGVKLQYDCYRRNSYGNTWTHLHLDGYPNARGWVWDDYLNDNGSIYPC
ncbi:MAG: hypothetical protein ABI047_02465 [Jatrophihabitantaceae bacterium]